MSDPPKAAAVYLSIPGGLLRGARKALSNRYGLGIRAAISADVPGLIELMTASELKILPSALATRLEAVQQTPGVVLIALDWGRRAA